MITDRVTADLSDSLTYPYRRPRVVALNQASSCSDSRVALPPAAVVSTDKVRSVAKRCR